MTPLETTLFSAMARRRARLPPDTTCFRWLDDELPGVVVDRFGPVAVLSLYGDGLGREEERICEALAAAPGIESVYLKRRPREARKLANQPSAELAPPWPQVGQPFESLIVQERGTRFEIRPANGLSVGLYLDARDARAWLRASSRGRRVLNTFAYTCAFGVDAALGGAQRVVNLDVSRKVLDWGERNYELNGLAPTRHDFISGDAFDWLGRLAKKGEVFDLLVLDPPGFATTRSSRFTAKRDYHRLLAAAQPLVASQGLLLALCNVEQSERSFEAQLLRGLGARRWRTVRRFGASDIDFRQPSALKCHVLELGARLPGPELGGGNAPR